jgi:hypothetical protein
MMMMMMMMMMMSAWWHERRRRIEEGRDRRCNLDCGLGVSRGVELGCSILEAFLYSCFCDGVFPAGSEGQVTYDFLILGRA